jgi:hypothetical protein
VDKAKLKDERKKSAKPKVAKVQLPAPLPPTEHVPLVTWWSSSYSYALLAVLTIACLLPFSNRGFHIDDTLFVFAARQISKHPLDPYGFSLVWRTSTERMADITKNPPLACYYGAVIGRVAGWSERAFHLAFMLPALALVLGIYRLAMHFTRYPLLAALVTLLTPGILVSACSVMCDTAMVALWIWAVILWTEGLQPRKPWYLAASAVLIAASALTKYFGASLVLLLAAYSFARLRRFGSWLWYLLLPVGVLVGYELWTQALYGQGLLTTAADFASTQRSVAQASTLSLAVAGLSFTGGCALSVLTFAPLTWSRRTAAIVIATGVLAATAMVFGWTSLGDRIGGELAFLALRTRWALVGSQLALCVAGGVFTLALAIADYWRRRDAASVLLALWVLGTFVFASFLNWTVNARSVLPLIPAAGILIARRLDNVHASWTRGLMLKVAVALIVSGAVSLWIAHADSYLANIPRAAANHIAETYRNQSGTLWYEGHWGFQYYMEQAGAKPVDDQNFQTRPGDLVVEPEDNTEVAGLPRTQPFHVEKLLAFPNPTGASTMCWRLGAGFYSSSWGPLPFAFGPVPLERFAMVRVDPGVH